MEKWFVILCALFFVACQPKHTTSTGSEASEAVESQPAGAVPAPKSFVGLTLEKARAKADKADIPHRVVRQDNEDFPVTRDYRPERLNFVVDKGIVILVTNG